MSEVKPQEIMRVFFLLLTLHSSLITNLACDRTDHGKKGKNTDTRPPEISVEEPVMSDEERSSLSTRRKIAVKGYAYDRGGVVSVVWKLNGIQEGAASLTELEREPEPCEEMEFPCGKDQGIVSPFEIPEIKLLPGDNKLRMTAIDRSGNRTDEAFTITFHEVPVFETTPRTNISGVVAGEPRRVVFLAKIRRSQGLVLNDVRLMRVDAEGKPLHVLSSMFDDGKEEHGDERAGDRTYSQLLAIEGPSPGRMRFRVAVDAKRGKDTATFLSIPFGIDVSRRYSEQELAEYEELDREAGEMYWRLMQERGWERAAEEVVTWLRRQPGVATAEVEDNSGYGGFSFRMKSGLEGGSYETWTGHK